MPGAFTVQEGALIWRCEKELLRLRACGPNAARVQAVQGPEFLALPNALETEAIQTSGAVTELDPEGAVLKNGRLLGRISSTGCLRFILAPGKRLVFPIRSRRKFIDGKLPRSTRL